MPEGPSVSGDAAEAEPVAPALPSQPALSQPAPAQPAPSLRPGDIDLSPEILRNPPVQRAAYSDRTAWLMALLSQAAYLKFEDQEIRVARIAKAIVDAGDTAPAKVIEHVQKLMDELDHDNEGRRALDATLASGSFRIVEIVDDPTWHTQAFLAYRESDDTLVLAFRGTEKNYKDIRTDLNARFFRRNGVRTHQGFDDAWNGVRGAVREALTNHRAQRIFVTGHSLGGALAVLATADLGADPELGGRFAACYTFGSPRVGDRAFAGTLKVPIYRVVHAADIVPRLPFTHIIGLLAWAARLIPWAWASRALETWLLAMRGYTHAGDMRYLTGGEDAGKDLHLLQNPGEVERVTRWFTRFISHPKCIYEDHSILRYANKLARYARHRNG